MTHQHHFSQKQHQYQASIDLIEAIGELIATHANAEADRLSTGDPTPAFIDDIADDLVIDLIGFLLRRRVVESKALRAYQVNRDYAEVFFAPGRKFPRRRVE